MLCKSHLNSTFSMCMSRLGQVLGICLPTSSVAWSASSHVGSQPLAGGLGGGAPVAILTDKRQGFVKKCFLAVADVL